VRVPPVNYLENILYFEIGSDKILFATARNGFLYSRDGIFFERVYLDDLMQDTQVMTSMAYGQGKMIATTDNLIDFDLGIPIIYSSDKNFETWEAIPPPIARLFLRTIIYNEKYNLFVAGGDTEDEISLDTSAVILVSQNGLNWILVYKYRGDRDDYYSVNCIVYNEVLNLFISVGRNTPILVSNDGLTWKPLDPEKYPVPGTRMNLFSIRVYPPKIFVVGRYIWLSENMGQNWKDITP